MAKVTVLSTLIALSLTCAPALADTQVITLKDGSQLKGELVGVNAGVYTVKTPIMGDVRINQNQVVSISAEGSAPQAMPMPAAASSGMSNGYAPQIQAAQAQLMANPDIMTDIQDFAQDPEIAQLISDPQLMQMIMAKDVNGLQNTPQGQALINNPKMRALIEKIQGQGVAASN